MTNKLLVVFGAGASHDCSLPGATNFLDVAFRPPLTSGIFRLTQPLEEALSGYGEINGPAASFLARMADGQGESLERFLLTMKNSKSPRIRQQYDVLTVFLQHQFDLISKNYLPDKKNFQRMNAYTAFISEIHAAWVEGVYDEVCLTTLNYDIILDRALEDFFKTRFETMKSYLNFEKGWSLIKFHGSCDWWYSWDAPQPWTGSRRQNATDIARDGGMPKDLAGLHLRLGVNRSPDQSIIESKSVFFPALAVPVDDKYGAICPEVHVNQLKGFVASSDIVDLLVIGFSGNDKDLIDQIAPSEIRRAQFVNGTVAAAESAVEAVKGFGLDLPRVSAQSEQVFNGGFKDFVVRHSGLQSFLSHARIRAQGKSIG